MNVIRYGFFGEDDAQRIFLHHYLVSLANGREWKFEIDISFPLIGGTKSRVKAQFDEACDTGLSYYQHDCFFIGLDLDDHATNAFSATVREMQQRLSNRNLSAILLIPVQCIEHWLWYLKWKGENPGSTKNINLEIQPRPDAKEAVYQARKCSTKHSNPIVERLSAGMDIEWLASRSASFLAFHQQVKSYLGALGLP